MALCHLAFVMDVKQSSILRVHLTREMIVQSQVLVKIVVKDTLANISRRTDQHEHIEIRLEFYYESNPSYLLARRGYRVFPIVQGLKE